MRITDILSPQAVRVPLSSTDKRAVVEELVEVLAKAGLVSDADAIKRVVWEREQQRSTGIGDGLAIPHGKSKNCDELVMAIGRPSSPIDFDAVDGKPVQLIVLLVSPPTRTADHIQALGKISRLMSDSKIRHAAYTAASAEELYKLFKEADQ